MSGVEKGWVIPVCFPKRFGEAPRHGFKQARKGGNSTSNPRVWNGIINDFLALGNDPWKTNSNRPRLEVNRKALGKTG